MKETLDFHAAAIRSDKNFFENFSAIKNTDLMLAVFGIKKVADILGYSDDWNKLRGVSILELGCGSRKTPRFLHPEGWPPYFCHLASNLGALVTGIELYPAAAQDAQVYRHIQSDLVRAVHTDAIEQLGLRDHTFDVVHSHFFTSTTPPSGDLSDTLKKQNISEHQFRNELGVAVRRWLKPTGVWIEEGD